MAIEHEFAVQLTLPNGKYAYVGIGSITAINTHLPKETVRFNGACPSTMINFRAHLMPNSGIKINGVCIHTFIEKVATEEEMRAY